MTKKLAAIEESMESLEATKALLRESEALVRSAFDAIQDLIVRVDRDGRILGIKPSLDVSLSKPIAELIGKPVSELFSPDLADLYLDAIHDVLNTQEARTFEHPIAGKRPEEFLEIRIFPVNQNQALFMIRDVSEKKKLERTKTDLVSFASHQLRTPSAQINGFANNLLAGIAGNLNEGQKKYVEFMRDISAQNLRLIGDLLTVTKSEEGLISIQPEPVSLREIVDTALQSIPNSNGRSTLVLNEIDPKITVYADVQKTVEAVRNVLENAVRFTKKGSIVIGLRLDGKFGVIEIEDTGPGIPEPIFRKLFTRELIFGADPTANGEGTGLGLYIAKRFMNLQEGDLTGSTIMGKGSTFTFTLPLWIPK